MARYVERVETEEAGVTDVARLPEPLPFGLRPEDFRRTAQDVHDILHEVNTLLVGKSFERMEELLDPAGFSGFISRTVADRLSRASRSLVLNKFHNGYPDLLARGSYAGDAVQRGEGGLEIKASRYEKSWQAHGPRQGWFCVTRFNLDQRDDVATKDLEPTRIVAIMVAQLALKDWNWNPAKEGSIRSGTASIKVSGRLKLHKGAVYVDPSLRDDFDALTADVEKKLKRERREL